MLLRILCNDIQSNDAHSAKMAVVDKLNFDKSDSENLIKRRQPGPDE